MQALTWKCTVMLWMQTHSHSREWRTSASASACSKRQCRTPGDDGTDSSSTALCAHGMQAQEAPSASSKEAASVNSQQLPPPAPTPGSAGACWPVPLCMVAEALCWLLSLLLVLLPVACGSIRVSFYKRLSTQFVHIAAWPGNRSSVVYSCCGLHTCHIVLTTMPQCSVALAAGQEVLVSVTISHAGSFTLSGTAISVWHLRIARKCQCASLAALLGCDPVKFTMSFIVVLDTAIASIALAVDPEVPGSVTSSHAGPCTVVYKSLL